MAGDWIPASTNLVSKIEVLRIAKETRRSRHEVVGLLLHFWSWASTESANGHLDGISVDDLCFLIGADVSFWESVHRSGWLLVSSYGIEIPNASHWLTNGAKSRLQKNKRQSEWRNSVKDDKNVDACVDGYVDADVDGGASTEASTTEEKRREEKRREKEEECDSVALSPAGDSSPVAVLEYRPEEKPAPSKPKPKDLPQPIPANLDSEQFREAWGLWRKHRSEIKHPLKPTMERSQLKMLSDWGHERAMAALNHTMAMGWQGIREPDPEQRAANSGRPF